jgi:putative transposase
MTCRCLRLVPSDKMSAMFCTLRHLIGWLISAFCSRQDLILENLALRQQLLALHAKRPRRRLSVKQKLFWVALRKLWQGWKQPLVLVTPRTVVEWHRAGFRLYWKWLSRAQRPGGRPPVEEQIRVMIFRMAAENPTWGGTSYPRRIAKTRF